MNKMTPDEAIAVLKEFGHKAKTYDVLLEALEKVQRELVDDSDANTHLKHWAPNWYDDLVATVDYAIAAAKGET